jgi:hypothetical protein
MWGLRLLRRRGNDIEEEKMAGFSFRLFGHGRVASPIRLSGTYWYVSLTGRTVLDLRESGFPDDGPVRIVSIKLVGHTYVQVPKGTTVEIGGLRLGRGIQEVDSADVAIPNRIKVNVFTLLGGVYVHS